MSLGLALSNALSGLNVNQSSLATTSNNITNANTEGYSRKTVQATTQVVAGQGVGAIPELKRIVDEFLTKAQRGQVTSTAKAEVVQNYMDRIQVYLGQPDAEGSRSIMTALDTFFSALSDVSGSPELPFFRTQAIAAAGKLADTIAALTDNLQQTRYDADQDIAVAVQDVNNSLDKLFVINKALREAYIAGQPQEELLDQRDKELRVVSKYLDVGVNFSITGEMSLFNQAGELLSPNTRFHLTYSPVGSVEALKNDQILGKLEVVALDASGNLTDFRIELASEDQSADVTTKLRDGKILGLIELRDTELPAMLAQLDSLANGLRDAVDAVHNDGVGYPPPASLTGTKAVRGSQQIGFSGSVMIAALNADGTPPASPYPNDLDGLYRPLTIDFSKVYGPNGMGQGTVADIINEINQHFGAPSNRVQMGPLTDVRLVAISDDTTGPFEFDIEFENASANDLSMTIVTVGGVAVGDGVVASAGGITRSSPVTYTAAGAGPYSIDVEVQFTDPDTGDVYNETITYTVPAAASGLRGDRYEVSALAGGATPPVRGSIVVPDNNQDFLIAQLVDANGNVVTSPTTSAYLQIIGSNGLRVGIDELDSNDDGLTTAPITAATDRAFSHYFELNNFFESQTSTVLGNAASNLRVRDTLLADPNLLAVGELTLSSQPTGSDAGVLYTYGLAAGSNQVAERLAAMRESSIAFSAAGGLPDYNNSATAYASEIYAYIGGVYNNKNNELVQQEILQKSYDDRMDSMSGVNLDEELANTVLFQNAYSASARIISVVNTLYETLLGIK